MSVSQLSSSVRSDRSRQPDGDRSGQPDECNSSKAQIRTLLHEQRQTVLAECHARVSHHELQAAQAEDKDNYGNRNWNFVKLINEILQRWQNYGNFRVLHSILWQDENSSRTRALSWNSAREYRNCKMQEDGILLSMTKIPHDDILEGLYKSRIRESEKLKTVLELYNMEIHQTKAGPDYHRLKTLVKRSIEQDIRNKNFGARNGNYEKNAVVKNQGTKQRVQRILGDCWQWETNGQCVKGDNCSLSHDINKRGKITPSNPSPNSFMQENERKSSRTRSPRGRSPSGRTFRWPCKDYLKGTCNNSFCEKWHPSECLFYKTKSGCRFGEKCSHAHRQVDEQPTKGSKKNDDKRAVAMLKKG